MDMPREIWADYDPKKQNSHDWVGADFLVGYTKYIRADLVEKVDDEAVREAVEWASNQMQEISSECDPGTKLLMIEAGTHIETLIRAATSKCDCDGLVEALEFYAARENLSTYDNGFIYEIVEDGDEVEIGTIARQALAAHREKGKV